MAEPVIRRLGIARVSLRALDDLLGLPRGHKIIDVVSEYEDRYQHSFRIIVEGPGMPKCREGELVEGIDLYMGSNGKVRFDSED